MIRSTFPFNPVLVAMSYDGKDLTLTYKNRLSDGKFERVYKDIEQTVAYTLYYKRTGSEVVQYYTKFIKKPKPKPRNDYARNEYKNKFK